MRIDELGRDTRPLKPVHKIPHLLQVFQMGTIGIESVRTSARPLYNGNRINDEFLDGTRVDLEMEIAGLRVLPNLEEENRNHFIIEGYSIK